MQLTEKDYSRFCVYWHQLPREKGQLLPARAAFNPTDMKTLLPFIFVLHAKAEMNLEVSLSGTALDVISLEPLTGKNYLDVCPPGELAMYWESLRVVREHPCGLTIVRDVKFRDGKGYRLKSITFPMLDASGYPSRILGLMASERAPRMDGKSPKGARISSNILAMDAIDVGAAIPPLFDDIKNLAKLKTR